MPSNKQNVKENRPLNQKNKQGLFVEKFEGDIKTLRKKLGWTRQRFAREVGISSATVNRWEHGKTQPSNLGLIRVARLVKQIGFTSNEGG